jgi:hypothetical protein
MARDIGVICYSEKQNIFSERAGQTGRLGATDLPVGLITIAVR